MKSEILYPGAFPLVRVDLASGETVKAESGAMVAASPTIAVESKMEGGVIIELDGVNEYLVQKDGFLAGAESVKIESQMQSLGRGLLGGEGLFILKISGQGQLILNSFGAIHKVELKPDQEYIVDNAHLVAWTATTSYAIERAAAGWIASFTSGEGFVCRFRGPGVVYIQSRNPGGFGAWIRQFIPVSE
ncbi:MAG: TIGR00266 family protein [Nitrospirae bacterium]|nr:TIGR00266 family protein [Nitrospirota bacterium]